MFRPTVDSVLDTFNTAIERLNEIAARESIAARGKRERSADLFNEANAHSAEMIRAESVAEKISALIS